MKRVMFETPVDTVSVEWLPPMPILLLEINSNMDDFYWLVSASDPAYSWVSLSKPALNWNGGHSTIIDACDSVERDGAIYLLDSMAELKDYLPKE